MINTFKGHRGKEITKASKSLIVIKFSVCSVVWF